MAETVVKVAHWSEIEAHLRHCLEKAHAAIENAPDEKAMWHLQGRAKVLRELLNLPETLGMIENG